MFNISNFPSEPLTIIADYVMTPKGLIELFRKNTEVTTICYPKRPGRNDPIPVLERYDYEYSVSFPKEKLVKIYQKFLCLAEFFDSPMFIDHLSQISLCTFQLHEWKTGWHKEIIAKCSFESVWNEKISTQIKLKKYEEEVFSFDASILPKSVVRHSYSKN